VKPAKFTLTGARDERIMSLVGQTDHRVLALWAKECAERVLPHFEKQFPNDFRPRVALETLKKWIDTGEFKMSVIRKAALDAHSAARDTGEDNPARSAARSAGQAVATAHVATHSAGAAIYALQAVSRTVNPSKSGPLISAESDWQYRRLLELIVKQ
jgi:hypothetical protein